VVLVSEKKVKPRFRFAGYNNEWKKVYLYEISERIIKKNRNNKITETFTNSAIEGIISQRDYFKKDISNVENISNYYIVEPDDFVYNPRISKNAPVGPIRRNNLGKTGIMSPLYFVFRNKRLNNKFLEIFFLGNYWHRHMFKYGNTGARADRFAIKISDLSKMKISHPSLNEQQKIGNLFEQLDQAISLQRQVLETTKEYKQSMLQKMFPKKDEKAPEIRFEGFNEEWTKTILEECVNSIPSKHYISKGETLSHGMHSVIQQGNDSILGYSNENNFYEQYQDVILFGDHTLSLYKPKNTFMVSTDGIKILQSDILDTDFLYILLQKYLPKSQGYKRHFTILKETLIRYPLSLKEQQKIGSFFKTLDEKIEQEKKKLEAYESMKKALMQRMFV